MYSVVSEIGRLTAALGGLDALVFTAGIGEHAPAIRRAICERLAWLGLHLDADANEASSERIAASQSTIAALVVPADEESMVARHTVRLALARTGNRMESTT